MLIFAKQHLKLNTAEADGNICCLEEVFRQSKPDDGARQKCQRFTKVITVHPVGTVNVWTKFYSDPSNRQDTGVKTNNVKIMVALQEKAVDHQPGPK